MSKIDCGYATTYGCERSSGYEDEAYTSAFLYSSSPSMYIGPGKPGIGPHFVVSKDPTIFAAPRTLCTDTDGLKEGGLDPTATVGTISSLRVTRFMPSFPKKPFTFFSNTASSGRRPALGSMSNAVTYALALVPGARATRKDTCPRCEKLGNLLVSF